MRMVGLYCRLLRRQFPCLAKCCIIGLLTIILSTILSTISKENQYIEIGNGNRRVNLSLEELKLLKKQSTYTYEKFTQWNRSLCGNQADVHGPHQKVISLSIFGTTSKFSNNPMYSWDSSILLFLEPLANEIKLSLPSWNIRIYVDFIGSTEAQRDFIYNLPNVDVCDIINIPVFESSLYSYLPGKMWRYLPIFDPYVDYFLSHDLDSPIPQREIETLDMWLSEEQKENFFYIARDHNENDLPIPGGLWGAAPIRARYHLFDIFQPILIPSIASLYIGGGDQLFLKDFIWPKVKMNSLSFDSHSCKKFGGRPFLSQRPKGNCFLGCKRPCCTSKTIYDDSNTYIKPCPIECRPKDHQDWTYC